ncbi:efflux transporter outer membrane subunit [Nitrospirillum viridazoti]|uniref:NodT family efflux transporter outer membrane factor (OMF) lipoprotein n=1 Tax=Nitrospirillum amazonense TaxID=28077 RepID=A0A560I5S5_9PROT|nr:efflux transporter outer membrane subunit [Nitrospirillum amazonense]TWB54297.1 NodT family efflux transporter outer membrane factor (OMF) lipoprotein [Nitrospirillum amazonense]
MIRRKALAALMLGGMVSACSVVGPDYKPIPLDGLPQGWTEQLPPAAGVSGASVPGGSVDAMRAWWDSFQDPTLSRLVQAAIVDNEDLKIARQRLVQARAARVIAKSADLPDVRLGIDPALQRSSENVDWPPGIGSYHTWQAELDATWEIDVFGGTRRAVEAADADIAATEEGRRAILVSLLAEVATDYARLRAAQLRLTIARDNIAVASKALDLAQRAYQRGLGTVLDVAQARTQLETVQAATPPLEAAVARMSHAIAVLLGRYPGELEAELSQPAPLLSVPDSLPVSVPSEVVANRPDIRQADRRYAAATARIGVATAASLPHFAIPLTLLPQAADLGKLFSLASLTYSLGAQVTGPVYNGGRDDARITLAKAEAEAARISYERTVKEALRDVEDALVNYQTETRRQQTLAAARSDAAQALDHATRLYSAGLTDFLKVLDGERQAYQAEDREAESRLARVEHVITLYKALGGGWQGVDLDKAD